MRTYSQIAEVDKTSRRMTTANDTSDTNEPFHHSCNWWSKKRERSSEPQVSFLTAEKLLEEEQVVVDGVAPVFRGVSAGTGGEVVMDASAEESLVKVFVHLEEEVILTAVEGYP